MEAFEFPTDHMLAATKPLPQGSEATLSWFVVPPGGMCDCYEGEHERQLLVIG
jgi:hypothetical protein